MDASSVIENYHRINGHIRDLAEKAGTKEGVTLVGVVKNVPMDLVKAAYSAGLRDFGENRAKALRLDREEFSGQGVNFHMIGNLQSNKIKDIVAKGTLIQSVGSLRMAGLIDESSASAGIVSEYLLQVNVANDENQGGIGVRDIDGFLCGIGGFHNIKLRGIMAILPIGSETKIKQSCKQMHKLFVDMKKHVSHNTDIKYLSMGMSGDYGIAVSEGSNMVRIGSSLFLRPFLGD